MIKTLLVVFLLAVVGFAAAKVLVALCVAGGIVVGAVVRYGVVPLLMGLGWLVGGVLLLPIKLLGWLLTPVTSMGPPTPSAGFVCRNHGCSTVNPPRARFCRRCGLKTA